MSSAPASLITKQLRWARLQAVVGTAGLTCPPHISALWLSRREQAVLVISAASAVQRHQSAAVAGCHPASCSHTPTPQPSISIITASCVPAAYAAAVRFMEERVQQFQRDAQRPWDVRTPKDVQKLRSFLFKNQSHRFTDASQTYLHQAVQQYAGAAMSRAEDDRALVLGLVEDALKMPFTVFTTSQKKSMLKSLDKLQGMGQPAAAAPASNGASATGAAASPSYQLIDLTTDSAELMDSATGDTITLRLQDSATQVVAAMRSAFEAEQDVAVLLSSSQRSVAEVLLPPQG